MSDKLAVVETESVPALADDTLIAVARMAEARIDRE